MLNEYYLTNIVLMRTIVDVLEKEKKKNPETIIPDVILKFRTNAWRYKMINDYSRAQQKHVLSIINSKRYKDITNKEISFLLLAMELIRHYVTEIPKDKRVNMNINDNKLKGGFRTYVKEMLELKKRNPEQYIETKGIIDDTREMARDFFWLITNQTKGIDL